MPMSVLPSGVLTPLPFHGLLSIVSWLLAIYTGLFIIYYHIVHRVHDTSH